MEAEEDRGTPRYRNEAGKRQRGWERQRRRKHRYRGRYGGTRGQETVEKRLTGSTEAEEDKKAKKDMGTEEDIETDKDRGAGNTDGGR